MSHAPDGDIGEGESIKLSGLIQTSHSDVRLI
jgi:hypothetical protein